MTPSEVDVALAARFEDLERAQWVWHAQVAGFELVVLADLDFDRIRVIIPVALVDRPDPQIFRRLLEANFSTALDARYGIYDGVLWAAFLAPLGALSVEQFDRAVTQVLELARTTGTSYSAAPAGTASRLH